jgi:hypothetical protein
MRILIGGLVIFLLGISGGAQAGERVYVQGDQAPIYAAPQLGKAPVAVVGKGTPLTVIGSNPRWYQVQGEGHEGWMVKFMVADHPPAESQAMSDSGKEILLKRARVRPSTYSTTAAARGLRAGGEGLKDADRVDYESVTLMEETQPTDEEVADFFDSEQGHD